jgi:hypothetical protein
VPELHGEQRVTEAPLGVQDLLASLVGREDPARELEEDRSQLARLPQRLHAALEGAPDLVVDVGRQVLAVDAALGGQLLGQGFADVPREALDLARLAGHQRVRLDVEEEVVRRPLRPQLRLLLPGQGVVRRVHLHQREA